MSIKRLLLLIIIVLLFIMTGMLEKIDRLQHELAVGDRIPCNDYTVENWGDK